MQKTLGPAIERQHQLHSWFTPEFCLLSLGHLADFLLDARNAESFSKENAQTIAVLPHGRTPLSGFRDLLYVLLSCHNALVRTKPHVTLLPDLVAALMELTPSLQGRITFRNELSAFNAVIADLPEQGGEALARHLSRFPHVLRTPVCHAVLLTGDESEDELRALSRDIYLYFGRAPRSVRKLYVHEGYDFAPFLHILHEESQSIAGHNHFLNHLDYQKSIRLMSKQFYMDSGTFLFVESSEDNPPPAVVYYEYDHDNGKPTVGYHNGMYISSHQDGVPFGQACSPALFDYDNNIDILQFLGKL
ncbi:MAG: hypothetical protein J6S48_02655 [Bacteroidales bacterium]|nr:hypothetical protein [Bacteroidales bacterium]